MTTPEPIDVEATKTRIAAMVTANDAAIRTLAQQGVGINVEVSAQVEAAAARSRLLEGVNGAAMPKMPGQR